MANAEPEVIAVAAPLVAEGAAKMLKQGVDHVKTQQRQAAAERHGVAMAHPPADGVTLYHVGIADLNRHVDSGSVDIIHTDPSDEPNAVPLYADPGKFAAHALKPGVLLLALSGSLCLPAPYRRLETVDGLKYLWQFICHIPGASRTVKARRMHTVQEPLIAYSKGAYTGEWQEDLITVPARDRQENERHRWQRQLKETQQTLSKFVPPGLTVCDPMMGIGTTGVAALALGCRFTGADIDPDCVDESARRIHKARTSDGRPRPDQPLIRCFAAQNASGLPAASVS